MTLKFSHLLTILTAASLSLGTFTSCDDISEQDRLIPMESVKAERGVLIEEFTGQRCTNCPDGHAAVHDIVALYPQTAIPVSIHASSLAIKEPAGLGNDEGAEYYKAQNNPALPAGVINRSTEVLQATAWMTAVTNIISQPTPLSIGLTASLDQAANEITVNTNLLSTAPVGGSLQLWVLEDGVVARQLDHGQMKTDYVHNHVFRGTINGLWGEPVSIETMEPLDKTHKVAVKSHWNTDNLMIVAFVYDSNGVINAAKLPLN